MLDSPQLQPPAEAGLPLPGGMPRAYTRLDLALVAFLNQVQASSDVRHSQLAALASHQFGRGNACLDLLGWPAQWQDAAQSMPWVDGDNSPLVWDGQRLYLRRNWQAEQRILADLRARLAAPCQEPSGLQHSLDQLFGAKPAAKEPDWQKIACALASRSRFTFITGGPGTGKTTTVVRLLALLQAQACAQGAPLSMALAAPTGKAAARLAESVSGARQSLPAGMQVHLPTQAHTLHKLLRLNSRDQRAMPLTIDVLVVDEASMIDLDMMDALLAAVPHSATLVLLGDQDQLASVEAGAILSQLCEGAVHGHYSAQTVAWLAQHTGQDVRAWALPDIAELGAGPSALAQQTVMLRHSRRFGADSAIGQWARAVNAGDTVAVQSLWQATPTFKADAQPTVVDCISPQRAQDPALRALVRQGWQPYLEALSTVHHQPCSDAQALALLADFGRFQVLCALREGPWGVHHMNRWLAQALGFAPEGWYAGRAVMVTHNDYHLQLMNGDVGLCLDHGQGLRVAFANGQGGVRWVLPARLDAVESVFAMSVHKSQGSEFEHACLLLPDQALPVLTRELLYTGITRAKSRLSLVAPRPEVLLQAVRSRVRRSGGLGSIHEPLPGA
jgi:exodeoxyribonuclease V alpha subunit